MSRIDLLVKVAEKSNSIIYCNWGEGVTELRQRNGRVKVINLTEDEIWELTKVKSDVIDKIPF